MTPPPRQLEHAGASRGAASAVGPLEDLSGERVTVRIRRLQHTFDTGESRKPVLEDITLDLLPGEIAVMTGPSGSGKTTLLTLIGALRSVQEGSLQVLGKELRGLRRRELVGMRRSIGFIFQSHNLFESLNAYQNVRMALDLYRYSKSETRERATQVLTLLGLGQRLSYKPNALSGGQRQRVAVARALVNRPKLILADEPTAALDQESSRDVVGLLQELARAEGSTIVLVTHDNRILDVADRIVSLVDGRIVSDVLVRESVVICEFLSKCPVFSGLTPGTLSEVADKMSREQYAPGTVLIRQGDVGDKFYLIRRGKAEVGLQDGPTYRVLTTLAEGEFFGERALMTGEPRSATVVATEALEVYTLGKDDFRATLEASAPFKQQLLRVFFHRQ